MQLKVLTLNVRIDVPVDSDHQWTYRLPTILAYILDQQPDVCFFQEVNEKMFEALQNGLPMYSGSYVGRNEDRHGEGCPIFVLKKQFSITIVDTIWLSHTPLKAGSMDIEEGFPRIAHYVAVKTKQGAIFHFINTHLAYRSVRNQDLNLKVLFDFAQSLDQSLPIIIGGDFNMNRQKITNYKPRAYTFSGESNTLNTYHEFQGGTGLRQIDHLITHQWIETSFLIDQAPYLGRHLSDHYPVIGEYIHG